MSEQKRASLSHIGTANSEKKSKLASRKTIRLNLTLPKPNEGSYPVFDYTELCRLEEKNKKKQNPNKSNGSIVQSDEEDDDVRRIARRFEEKYGKGDKEAQNSYSTYSELGAGYDENDSFIDNTDACDEALPEEMQTPYGGFYINSGRLEYKKVELSDHSDIDEVIARRKKKGLQVVDEEEEDDDEEEEEEVENNEPGGTGEEPKKEEALPSALKKVKISEDKPIETAPPSVTVDKDVITVTKNPDSESKPHKANKRKLHNMIVEGDLSMKKKKKSLTVKALLEEKRVVFENSDEPKKTTASSSSINDAIESVIRQQDDSNSSSIHSVIISSESENSNDVNDPKPSTNIQNSIPLPDNLPSDVLQVVFKVQHLASITPDLTRKTLSDDINTALIELDSKSKDLATSLRHTLYSHLSCYLPCTKDTLMKRTKKLIIQREEDKLKEPIKKLKAAVNAMMPVLLEKYQKECQRLALEQGNDVSGNNINSNVIVRRKFPWNDELRGYLNEIITGQLNCFNILRPRKETSESYVIKFLNTNIRPLWPPGWMKANTLLREGRISSVEVKARKHPSSGTDYLNKITNSVPRLNLPSSTTVTPSNGTIPSYTRTDPVNYQQKPISTITSTSSVLKPSVPDSSNLISKINSFTSSISPPKKSHSPSNSVTISPVKKESFSMDSLLKKNIETVFSELNDKKDSVSVITMNGSAMPFKDLSLKLKKDESNSNNSGDKILDLSSCATKHHSVIHNLPSDRTTVTNGESVNLNHPEEVQRNANSNFKLSKPKEETLISPPVSQCIKSPPPYISKQEAERRLSEETATATDILSQIINESLRNTPTPLPSSRLYEDDHSQIQEERKYKPRTMSIDQDIKCNPEVDQVIQDLVELRQMSGGTDRLDGSKVNYNTSSLGMHHKKSHIENEESPKMSSFGGFQDEFYKHILKKETPLPPAPLLHNVGSFQLDNSNYHCVDNIPKSMPYSMPMPPHYPNQSMSQHSLQPPSSKSAQINQGNNSLSLSSGSSESSPSPH
uniref:Ubinuclein middle domain-containing protein n=1 Tax=Clastoptera arizonana TaxID=38151 RepID=A0A1B6C5K3_9HEMI